MSKFTLDAVTRDRAGKGVARQLRAKGRVPAVIYGAGQEPALISLDGNTINLMYRRGHMGTALGTLNVDGAKQMVLSRDVSLHPVKDVVEHVDFLRVSDKTRITVSVPLRVIGQEQSPAMLKKAIITYAVHEIAVDCIATAIPEHIDVDISACDIGTHLHASDLKLPKGVKLHSQNEKTGIISLELPKVSVEEVAPAAAAPATAPAAKAAPAKK